MKKLICIAKILRPHGIKGWVKFYPYLESPSSIQSFDALLTQDQRPFPSIQDARLFHQKWALKFKDIDTPEALTPWLTLDMYIPRDTLPVPAPDAYYYEDLKGMTIKDKNQIPLGQVAEIQNFGAEDLLSIHRTSNQHQVLIPFRRVFFPHIAMESASITISDEGIVFLEAIDT